MRKLIARKSFNDGGQFLLVHGDLTKERVDAIVNAANAQLAHGGGVAAAIVRAGGPAIRTESERWLREHGPIDQASPAITSAGSLPCRAVIHVVGPRWGEGDEDTKLGTAVQAALQMANQRGFGSLALPPVSTGIFGYPAERAAGVIFDAVREFFDSDGDLTLREVRLVIIDQQTLDVCAAALQSQLALPSDGV